jgi:hypothetical protein
VGAESKGLSWFHYMRLQLCLELMHVLFECSPLHEQGPMCNHANGGGVGFGVNSKHLREARASALIMCSSCNASQCHPCINVSKCEYLSGLFHHLVKEGQTLIKE